MQPGGQNGGSADPELPALETGVRLLDVESDERATGPLHSLVLDHLLTNDGNAVWGGRGGLRGLTIASLARAERPTLDRIRVARGFTAHQHYSLVCQLREQVDEDTSLVVCPTFDHCYRDTETYADEGDDLFLRALATILRVADQYDVPASSHALGRTRSRTRSPRRPPRRFGASRRGSARGSSARSSRRWCTRWRTARSRRRSRSGGRSSKPACR